MVSIADIPVEVVGHPPVDSIQYPDPAQQPPPVIASSLPMPVISEDTVNSIKDGDGEWSNKRRKVDTSPPQSPTVTVDGFYELEYTFNIHSHNEPPDTFARHIRGRHISIPHSK